MKAKTVSMLSIAMISLALMAWVPANGQEQVLYSFGTNNGPSDAVAPYSWVTFDQSGNLYGTGTGGGVYGNGAVFQLTPGSGGSWNESVIFSFTDTNGLGPVAGLTLKGSLLYGTTPIGGPSGGGEVYVLRPQTGGGWAQQVLYNFRTLPNPSGASPYGGVVLDSAGNIYGTDATDGTGLFGTVFEVSPGCCPHWQNGWLFWNEKVLNNFDISNGAESMGTLIADADGNLYGTTQQGGTYNGGTAFELSPGANGQWTETVLYNFGALNTHGLNPIAGLILDSAGNLYGTTYHGGSNGYGAAFELSRNGTGWSEKVLHSFGAVGDGFNPTAPLLLDHAGSLYGTTSIGGAMGYGTVFKLTPGSGGSWTETVLYSFDKLHGANPYAGLVADPSGNLYGTTVGGGANLAGVVFEVTP